MSTDSELKAAAERLLSPLEQDAWLNSYDGLNPWFVEACTSGKSLPRPASMAVQVGNDEWGTTYWLEADRQVYQRHASGQRCPTPFCTQDDWNQWRPSMTESVTIQWGMTKLFLA